MTGGKEFGCISPGVADLLREMIGFTAQELEVEGLIDAAHQS